VVAPARPGRPSDGGTIVGVQVLILGLVVIVAIIVVWRVAGPDPQFLFQGMFRYQSDGWPRGVQEDDGERAWMPVPVPDFDPEEDELAWAATIGPSTIAELDGVNPRQRVPIVRVKAEVSTAPRHREP
jgi:hypothetical protein